MLDHDVFGFQLAVASIGCVDELHHSSIMHFRISDAIFLLVKNLQPYRL